MGLFTEVPIGLISMSDCLRALETHNIGKKERAEFAVLLREPLAVDNFHSDEDPEEMLANLVLGSMLTKMGWKYGEVVKNLETARKEKAARFQKRTEKIRSTWKKARSEATKKMNKDNVAILKKFGAI